MSNSSTRSTYTKCEYPIHCGSDTFVIPHSAAISVITPQRMRYQPLIAGYCKTCTVRDDIDDVRSEIVRFYCINTIEIYMEKRLGDVMGMKDGIKEDIFSEFGISHCIDDPQRIPRKILIGTFGKYLGSDSRNINVLMLIPEGVKYQKGSAIAGGDLPCLDGCDSIAKRDGTARKDKFVNNRQRMIDNLSTMNETQLSAWMQFMKSREIQNVEEKSIEDLVNEYYAQLVADMKDWIAFKEEVDEQKMVITFNESDTEL